MRKLIVLIIICSWIKGFGQNTDSLSSKWRIGVNYSYDICNVEGLKQYLAPVMNTDNNNGFTLGLNIDYKLSKYFTIESGIQFSTRGYLSDWYLSKNFVPGYAGYYNKIVRNVYTYNYIEVPLLLKLTLGKGHLKFIGGIGLIPEVLLSFDFQLREQYNNNNTQEVEFNGDYPYRLNVCVFGSAGLQYEFNNGTGIRIEPNYSLQALTDNGNYRLYKYGINGCLYFKFSKS
jgi:hypothetical protein